MSTKQESERMRLIRERAEKVLEPYRYARGDEAPEVKVALRILQVAAEVDAELSERREPTARAAEITHWSVDTLQARARSILAGEPVPRGWEGLRVFDTGAGYEFVIDTIPAKRAVA